MTTPERAIEPFDPHTHLASRWSEWTVKLTEMHGVNEVFDARRRVILIDPQGDEPWALAHAAAHLDLSHHLTGEGGPFSPGQEADADWLARINLDLIEWPPTDGDPSVPWSALT